MCVYILFNVNNLKAFKETKHVIIKTNIYLVIHYLLSELQYWVVLPQGIWE